MFPRPALHRAAWLCGILILLLAPSTASAQTAAAKEKKKPKPIFRWTDHPTIKIHDVTFVFRARFQGDWVQSDASTSNPDAPVLDIAKRRVGVEGEVGKLAEYQVEADFAQTAGGHWRDVYLNYRQLSAAQVQVGQFKMPFSLDENTSPTNLDFMYRSLAASTLAPGRDVGVMAHGRVIEKLVRYQVGVFRHDGRNAKPGLNSTRVFGGRTSVARLNLDPFRSSKSPFADLTMGVAWTSGDVPEGLPGVRGHTELGEKFFAADYLVNGRRQRVGYEVRWRPGPASLQAEYIRMTDERLGLSVTDEDLNPIRATGWYVSGTYAVTGDRKAVGLDGTKHPVQRGGTGAIELAARIERLAFGSGPTGDLPSTSVRSTVIVGNTDRVTTLGVNWYANRWVKVQFNVIREELQDPSLGPAPGAGVIWSKAFRVQLSI